MEDLASLGFHVDSSGIKGATRELRKMDAAQERAEKSNRQLTAASNVLKASLIGLAGAVGVREIAQYSDNWKNAENQLKQVTSTTRELNGLQSELLELANDTRSSFGSTANLYARLARSTKQLGLSSQELIGITGTINRSFIASGATAQEASNAITQLSQGLSAGALRGEEFNSVSEQAPIIMEALVKATGMGRGALRDFAAEGGITSELLIAALNGSAEEIGAAYEKMSLTLGQSLVVAENKLQAFIGRNSAFSTAMEATGESVIYLADNIDKLADIGAAAAIVYGGRFVSTQTLAAASTLKNAAASVQAAKATAAATAAEVSFLRSVQGSLSAQLADAASATRRIALRQQLAANTTALTAAQARYTTALASSTIAARAATGAMAALNGVMTFLGGPLGVALIAAGSMYYFRDALFSGRQEASEAVKEIQGLADGYRDLTKAQVENERYEIASQMRKNKIAIAEAREELERLQQKQSERNTGNTLVPGGMSGVVDITKTQSEIAELIRQNEALEQSMEALDSRGEELTSKSGERDSRRAQSAAEAVDKIISSLQDEYLQLTLNEEQLLRHKLAVQGASDAEVELAVNTLKASRAIEEQRKQQDALSEMRRDLDPAFDEFSRYADQIDAIEAFNITAQEKEQLREAAFWAHQERMADIAQQGSQEITDASAQWADRISQNQMQIQTQMAQTLGNTIGFMRNFAEEGSAIWIAMTMAQKGVMAAQAVMAANLAATQALTAQVPGDPAAPAKAIAQAEIIRNLGYANAALILGQGVAEVAGARADGGSVSGGKSYLVGERGPEVVTMGGSGHVTPNHKLGGGDVMVQINDMTSGNHDYQTEETTDQDGQRRLRVIIRDTVNNNIARGEHDRAMGSRFDLKSKGRRV